MALLEQSRKNWTSSRTVHVRTDGVRRDLRRPKQGMARGAARTETSSGGDVPDGSLDSSAYSMDLTNSGEADADESCFF